jgi:dTDP-4-dehydrorhamnose reductase
MKILILGITGMLGNAMFRVLSETGNHDVWGTVRNRPANTYLKTTASAHIVELHDVNDDTALKQLFEQVKPEVVVNCIGLVKQLTEANEPLHAIPINALLPHRLSALCIPINARLIHISTDCVFSGKTGNYRETDLPDATDLYGRSKLLGEVFNSANSITLRTSIIGHELTTQHSLIEWFLSQQEKIKGYTKAIFSGLPTNELARIVRDIVIPRPELHGLYHVAAAPINKYDLLTLVSQIYGKHIEITADDKLSIDRSLSAQRFHDATGYSAPEWPALIKQMYEFHRQSAGDCRA